MEQKDPKVLKVTKELLEEKEKKERKGKKEPLGSLVYSMLVGEEPPVTVVLKKCTVVRVSPTCKRPRKIGDLPTGWHWVKKD